nr:ATP synthase F0 subunit 6 [Lepidostoma basale]UOU85062.1 ATP synthase F0 subunit 6 [Lepidostoma basale]
MMSNLFMIFDPYTNIFNLPLNWMSFMLGLTLIPYLYWAIPNRWNFSVFLVIYNLHKEFKTLIGKSYASGSTLMLVSLFTLILMNNFLGLFPYIFTSTSHMAVSFSLALPLWMSFMIFGWINNTNHMFTHLVPQGTPTALMSFMVIIETISNLIRPGTLAVRLMANMIAGHLLITLLSSMNLNVPHLIIYFLTLTMLLLLTLEIAISMIQAYVFTVLSTLYSSEIS